MICCGLHSVWGLMEVQYLIPLCLHPCSDICRVLVTFWNGHRFPSVYIMATSFFFLYVKPTCHLQMPCERSSLDAGAWNIWKWHFIHTTKWDVCASVGNTSEIRRAYMMDCLSVLCILSVREQKHIFTCTIRTIVHYMCLISHILELGNFNLLDIYSCERVELGGCTST